MKNFLLTLFSFFCLNLIISQQMPNYQIGTTWTFECIPESPKPGEYFVKFKNYQIIDTVHSNGRLIYCLGDRDSFYLEDDKMFFWDDRLKSYEMHYDFASVADYEIKYFAFGKVQIAKVKVDSVYNTIVNSDTIPTQILKIENNGSYPDEEPFIVYKYIGASRSEIKLHLGYGLIELRDIVSDLRCFKTENKTINFQSYPCDSTWYVTSTSEIGKDELIVHPNPTYDQVYIDELEYDILYDLIDLQGNLLVRDRTKMGKISLEKPGLFILKLYLPNQIVLKRIVKL